MRALTSSGSWGFDLVVEEPDAEIVLELLLVGQAMLWVARRFLRMTFSSESVVLYSSSVLFFLQSCLISASNGR